MLFFAITIGSVLFFADTRGFFAMNSLECHIHAHFIPHLDWSLHFALMGFPYESAPPPSQVASSLQSRRSKLRHSHEGHTTMFHHVDHHALESAMSRALGLWYASPGQFRQLMINGMQQDHS
jgi:hypothetical protein